MTKGIFRRPVLEAVLRWLLGLAFVYSSLHKIADPAQFARVVFGYGLFPQPLIHPIAVVVPFVELFAGAALLLGIWPRSAALIVETLLALFIAFLSINLARGLSFDCGCFSFGEATGADAVVLFLVRDALFFLAGLQVLLFRGGRRWCMAPGGFDR